MYTRVPSDPARMLDRQSKTHFTRKDACRTGLKQSECCCGRVTMKKSGPLNRAKPCLDSPLNTFLKRLHLSWALRSKSFLI